MAVTMRDVADVMGVSVMTVSNAFNRPDQLSGELRDRILARAAKMGYGGPHAGARALRQGHTNAFGIVFDESLAHAFSDPFTTEWLTGFAEEMAHRRSSIVLMSVPADDLAGAESVRNTSVDGLASMCASHPIVDAAQARKVPVVSGDPGPGDFVSIDEHAAGGAITGHLTGLGHEHVWVLIGAPWGVDRVRIVPGEQVRASGEVLGVPVATWARFVGVVDGLAGRPFTVVQAPTWDRAAAVEAAPFVLDLADRPTAILALSDNLALGLLDAMAERGLRPGQDVSVSGFDDIPEAASAGLTTVHQPIREKGRLTANLLLHPDSQPRQVVLPHRLVVRRSTGPRRAVPTDS